MTATVYRTSQLNGGVHRSTNAELVEIDAAIYDIAEEEQPITVRGLFYRMVSRGLVPKTHKADKDNGVPSGYGIVQRETLKMRRRGDLPYNWITDGTRLSLKPRTFSSALAALDNTARSYRQALWDNQDVHVEFWAEKDAIRGVVYPVTAQYDVPLMIARGYSSETFLQQTAQDIAEDGKTAVIYQLGDHDRDGVRAWQAIQKRLRAFIPAGIDLIFERIAVTPEQIIAYQLPTRPDKTDSGFGQCVEVDAIPTPILRELVTDAVEQWIDPDALRITKIAEDSEREILLGILNHEQRIASAGADGWGH